MTADKIRAPELPENLEWFNTQGEPVTLAQLRGKVVLLNFWTYCSINCMHVLDDIAWLEKRYPDSLAVIGIHSPKFLNERKSANLQKAINRYYIRHPVVNDAKHHVWKEYGIKAWPSIIYIDPEGYVVGLMRGEAKRKQLDKMIQQSIADAEANKTLHRSRFAIRLKPEPSLDLKFPGKIIVNEERMFISDSGHNRVIECMTNGRIVQVYGSGVEGLIDGPDNAAAFDSPQGLAHVDNFLYVADAGNHAIRKIDLITREVSTIAGMGTLGRVKGFDIYHDPLSVPLDSPWDLEYEAGHLYIAMAGSHQIWSMDLNNNIIRVWAGTGHEDLVDGVVHEANLAQPSGLSLGEDIEKTLFFVDAESSSVRGIRVRDNVVHTITGKGLFDYGDRDGARDTALLQHPMAICYDRQRKALWVADTYNHKLKHIKLFNGVVTTVNQEAPLDEPGGMSLHGEGLYVANTNAHKIVRVDLNSGRMEDIEIFEVETD